MTKQAFWRAIANSIHVCTYCPAKPNNIPYCHNGCAKTLQEFYERLEREINDD